MNRLHIVSFDVPFPANYGGVIDVYYKLYWLKQAGVKIHLHCFTYGRNQAPELESLCEKVDYYPRKTGWWSNLGFLPYTVKSRQSRQLEENLLSNQYPIVFEVLHTCYLLNDSRLANRKKVYRHSNIEHEYYNELAKTERGLLKRIFLRIEAKRLKWFESILKHADLILAVNQKDTDYFKAKFPAVRSVYLPSFHPNATLTSQSGKGNYVLFHGNLSVSENYEAALWLINEVFCHVFVKVIIAGLNPPAFLKEECRKLSHIQLVENPDADTMNNLITEAQSHVIYTAQPTGLKLKLLNVLFGGRFVVCNANMLSGTGLKANSGLLLSSNASEYITNINLVMNQNFSSEMKTERERMLLHFNNSANAAQLIKEVF